MPAVAKPSQDLIKNLDYKLIQVRLQMATSLYWICSVYSEYNNYQVKSISSITGPMRSIDNLLGTRCMNSIDLQLIDLQ